MKIPVLPFLTSLMLMAISMFLTIANRRCWPLLIAATAYFLYCSNRELFHNGKPLVVGRKR